MELEKIITPETVGGAVVGLPLFWVFNKKILLKTAVVDTGLETTEAQCSVIEMLRKEVQRMSESNKELGLSLQQIQRENVELRKEISVLNEDINVLTEWKSSINRIRDKHCSDCEFNEIALLHKDRRVGKKDHV